LSSRLPNGIDAVWLYTYLGCARLLAGEYLEAQVALESGYAIIAKNPALAPLETVMRTLEVLALLEIGLQEGVLVPLEKTEQLCRAVLPFAERTRERFASAVARIVMGRIGLERGDAELASQLLEECDWQNKAILDWFCRGLYRIRQRLYSRLAIIR
jgi:hypothetical protein